MRELNRESCREALTFVIEARVGADETARILNQARRGDDLVLVDIAEALDIEPDELFAEFVAEVFLLTGENIRPIGHVERRLH
ncbi:MAG TPA: hypothetical protein VMW68_00770 [Methyloceanibacter sp.]|nr:hypothetical protein [Methyloceanibacter sp.]